MTLLARVGRLFPRNQMDDVVATKAHFDASPDVVWREMIFYEEVPRRPAPLLRLFLPAPVRTRGEKTRVGAVIECTYEGGYLEKVITAAEPARFVRFDVLVQRLGVEDCISMGGGSYEYSAVDDGCDVVLTTGYRGHLRPRWLFRPFERFLAHRLHRHILDGMRTALDASRSARAVPALACAAESGSQGK
jgi:hypothetical protein